LPPEDARRSWSGSEKAALVWVAALLVGVAGLLAWPWILPVLEGANAPAWVQAIGSVGAIIAAVIVMHRQHQQQLELLERQRTDSEVTACRRALLVCVGDLEMLRIVRDGLASGRQRPFWPFNVNLPRFVGRVSIDLQSLDFLIGKDAQVLLNEFSLARLNGDRLYHQVNALIDIQYALEPLFESAESKKGAPLEVHEIRAALGTRRCAHLEQMIEIVEQACGILGRDLPSQIATLSVRLKELYPSLNVPAPSPLKSQRIPPSSVTAPESGS